MNTAEGMRQATKQFDDLITPRVKQYGGKIPPDLQVKMDIFKKVNRGEISTREAEKMLNSLGTTKEGVVDQMGDFLRNVEKREGDVYRAVLPSTRIGFRAARKRRNAANATHSDSCRG